MVIPERFMGLVIGKGREKLTNIETKTGVALKVIESDFYKRKESHKRNKGHYGKMIQ